MKIYLLFTTLCFIKREIPRTFGVRYQLERTLKKIESHLRESLDIHQLFLQLKVEVDQRMEVEKLVTKSCGEWDSPADNWKAEEQESIGENRRDRREER